MLEREHGVSPGGPGGLRPRIEEYHGHRLPPDLDLMYRMREERRFGYCNYGEWRMWDEDAWAPEPARGNLCEQLILMDQKNYLGTALREYLVGLVPIGTAGNGDVYFSYLDLAHPENTEVFLWDHEERDLNGFADCIPSLAELNRLYVLDNGGGEADEGDVLAAVQRGMKKLEARVAPSWHYSDVVEHGEVEPGWKSASSCGFLYYRAAWLDTLLRQDSVRKLEVSSWFKHFIPSAGLGLRAGRRALVGCRPRARGRHRVDPGGARRGLGARPLRPVPSLGARRGPGDRAPGTAAPAVRRR